MKCWSRLIKDYKKLRPLFDERKGDDYKFNLYVVFSIIHNFTDNCIYKAYTNDPDLDHFKTISRRLNILLEILEKEIRSNKESVEEVPHKLPGKEVPHELTGEEVPHELPGKELSGEEVPVVEEAPLEGEEEV